MKSGIAGLLSLAILVGAAGCKKPVYHGAGTDADPEFDSAERVLSEPEVAPIEEEEIAIEVSNVPTTAPSELAAAAPEPEQTTPAPVVLDPQTQARVRGYELQIAKITKKIEDAKNVITDAQTFHAELSVVYEAEDKKAAAMKAARVYARMRNSSCSS